jgi:hypothetical protein
MGEKSETAEKKVLAKNLQLGQFYGLVNAPESTLACVQRC